MGAPGINNPPPFFILSFLFIMIYYLSFAAAFFTSFNSFSSFFFSSSFSCPFFLCVHLFFFFFFFFLFSLFSLSFSVYFCCSTIHAHVGVLPGGFRRMLLPLGQSAGGGSITGAILTVFHYQYRYYFSCFCLEEFQVLWTEISLVIPPTPPFSSPRSIFFFLFLFLFLR